MTIASAGPTFNARVLIIADSLAMPRDEVGYEHTWPALLAASIPSLIVVSRALRQSTTERLNGEGNRGADCLEFYRPDLAVLQLGICDCAPRVLGSWTAALVYPLPFGLGARLSAWLERLRGRKVANCMVPLPAYERNMRAYLTRAAAQGVPVIAISVMPASRSLVSRNPLVVGQIAAYNAALDKLAREFDCLRVLHPFHGFVSVDELFVDGYHLNEAGARRVAAGLTPLVRQVLAARTAA
jgi:lysophospholipase L1-like esterase